MAVSSHTIIASPLFDQDSVLEVVLTAPISQAYADKKKDEREWYPGILTLNTATGKEQFEVSIKTRGIFRRLKCRLPPLKLNFKSKEVAGTDFAKQDKLKLVAPCDHKNRSQQNVILEYLAYRSLQVLSEYSFKTRLVRVTYNDSVGKLHSWTQLGFILEDERAMSNRLGMQLLHVDQVHSSKLEPETSAIMDVFQFLIANNDFSPIRVVDGEDCCHNVKLLSDPSISDKIFPVPYDFDMSGLVNAVYASPPEQIPIKSVRTRYFRGRCKSPELWEKTFALFQLKRNEILGLFENSQDLDSTYKKNTGKFLQKFYRVLDNPKLTQRQILRRCKGKVLP